jgi:exopolyphosphatase/pppGpp-phosphohydrolase
MHQPGYERSGGRKARDERTKAAPHAHSTRRGSVCAAIDVGSNSVHMLVALVDGDSIVELGDRSTYFGLGPIVDRGGAIGAHRDRLVATIGDYVARARRLGASDVRVVGTEPLRRAVDSERASAELERRIGVTLDVLSHEDEAFLMTVGARAGRRVTRRQLLVDVAAGAVRTASSWSLDARHGHGESGWGRRG